MTRFSLRKFSLFDQIKEESKSEAFKLWILLQSKRNATKREGNTP